MERTEGSGKGLNRRQILGLGAAAVALAAAASLPLRALTGRRRADPRIEGIPGEGSIFQPRPGAVDDFLRRNP